MVKGWIAAYGALCERRWGWALLGVMCALALAGLAASRLRLEADLLAMLPADAAERAGREDMLAQVPSGTELLLAVRGEPAQVEAFLAAAAHALTTSGHVKGFYPTLPVDFLATRWLHLLPPQALEGVTDALAAALRDGTSPPSAAAWAAAAATLQDAKPLTALPISLDASGRWRSADGQWRLVLIEPNANLGDFAAMPPTLQAIESTLAAVCPPSVTTRLGGRLPVIVDEYLRLQRGMATATAVAFALIIALLWVALGGWRALPNVILPLLAGSLCATAAVALALGRLNMLSSLMFPILLGLGVDMCIHLQDRWRRGDEPPATVLAALWWPCAASTATSAAAFAALGLSAFPGIAAFGVAAALGMVAMQVGVFAVWPLIAARTARPAHATHTTPTTSRWATSRRAAGAALCACGALCLLGLSGLPRLRFDNDLAALSGTSRAADDEQAVMEIVGRALDPTLWMTQTLDDARAISAHMRAHPDAFAASLSIADVLPQDPTRSAPALARMRALLTRLRDHDTPESPLTPTQRALLDRGLAMTSTPPWGVDEVPAFWRTRLRAKDGQRWLVYGWGRDRLSTEHAASAWAQRVDAASAAAQHPVAVLDEGRVVARMFTLMRQGVWPMISAALAAVLLTLLAFTRLNRRRAPTPARASDSTATAAMTEAAAPVAAAIGLTLGVMGWLNTPLQFYNMAALPILLGVSVDSALHLHHGRAERGPHSTPQVLHHQGYAALLSALTTTIGFGALCLADHPGVASLGWLAALGVTCSTLFTLVALPAWWTWRDARRPR